MIGIPLADRLVIWRYMEEESVEVAMDIGPPEAAAAAPAVGERILLNNNDNRNRMIDFMYELDEDDSDDFQDLNDANDGLHLADHAGDREQIWSHETVTRMIQFSYIGLQKVSS
jgi:hypothetical protein